MIGLKWLNGEGSDGVGRPIAAERGSGFWKDGSQEVEIPDGKKKQV